MLFVNILLLIFCFLGLVVSEEVPEFQFPCYVDVCTFPRQFCNSDKRERRCGYCTRSLCLEERVPTACRYICMKYEEETKTSTITKSTADPLAQHSQIEVADYLHSLFLTSAYIAITVTLVAVVLLLYIAYSMHVRRRDKKRRNKPEKGTKGQYTNVKQTDIDAETGIEMKEKTNCRYCGRPTEAYDHTSVDMEPQRMNVVNNTGPPSYKSKDVSGSQKKPTFTTQAKTESGENVPSEVVVPSSATNNFSSLYNNNPKTTDKNINTFGLDIANSSLLQSRNSSEETSLKGADSIEENALN